MAASDWQKTPIVIICRDRLEPLQLLLDWLDKASYTRPILLDNASTFPPLLDFFDSQTDIEAIRLARNLGHRAPWVSHELKERLPAECPFVITDCDVVPDDSCPPNVVEHLAGLLTAYPEFYKAGLGLRIDDLPDSFALKEVVLAWEAMFWRNELAPGVFHAGVDTTFAVYRDSSVPYNRDRSLRTGPPYIARHLPWYSNSASPTDEQRYYRKHADQSLLHSEFAWTDSDSG